VSLPTLPNFAFNPPQFDVKGMQQAETLDVVPNGSDWLVPLRLTTTPGAQPPAGAVPGATIRLRTRAARVDFTSLGDGSVYATWPAGDLTVRPRGVAGVTPVKPDFMARSGQPQEQILVEYQAPPARITIRPALRPFGPADAMSGVTFELVRPGQNVPLRQVTRGAQACVFSDLQPGQVTVRIVAPAEYEGTPVALIGGKKEVSVSLAPGDDRDLSSSFRFKYATGRLRGRVVDGSGGPVSGVPLVARSDGQAQIVRSGSNGRYTLRKLRVGEWTIMLDQSAVWTGGRTLVAAPAQSAITVQVTAGRTVKAGDFALELEEHGIRGQIRDEAGQPVPYATVQIRDQQMTIIDTVVADAQGNYAWTSPSSGRFVVSLLRQDGETVQRQTVTVNSWTVAHLISYDGADGSAGGPAPAPAPAAPVTAAPKPDPVPREAIIDLASYPVLTEEVSTTGPPAPSAGGSGGAGRGAGYGQAVDQAIRDVLGWRPGGDVAGFQAALTGAFQLKEVEGHTQWSWQQRGYAVQADMGALTGAQASIYARAKSALDQILPLLAGLTPLNPALYPPQDLEAIRTVITAELQELVSELALEGSPRIQRVDELFGLLLGDKIGSTNLNPDLVQGQLGQLRDRFGLTASEIDTVEEERIVTNFRIVVEQVLALQASWSTDRGLLSPTDPRAAFGTILIWLSRSLEAVCESVDDLMFALDSVYVDAAQRQVIELRFGVNEPVLLLSDLLDWVARASRDEGPRIIQDAGKDGVFAFAPVLARLQSLIQATRRQAHAGGVLPDGMRTPRVDRALSVLSGRLDDAAGLAGLVRRNVAPRIEQVTPATLNPDTGTIAVTITGNNFRRGASAVLFAENREDLPELAARNIQVTPPGSVIACFRDPCRVPGRARVTWLLVITNEDGAQSNPVAIQMPS
jgi:hypothetical protein